MSSTAFPKNEQKQSTIHYPRTGRSQKFLLSVMSTLFVFMLVVLPVLYKTQGPPQKCEKQETGAELSFKNIPATKNIGCNNYHNELLCCLQGFKGNITWQTRKTKEEKWKNMKEAQYIDMDYIEFSDQERVLKFVQVDDRNEAYYQCSGSDGISTKTLAIHLEVIDCKDWQKAPEFLVPAEKDSVQYAKIGEKNFSIGCESFCGFTMKSNETKSNCNALGWRKRPPKSYIVYHPELNPNNTPYVVEIETGIKFKNKLVIPEVTKESYGTYECTAFSITGKPSVNVALKEKAPDPDPNIPKGLGGALSVLVLLGCASGLVYWQRDRILLWKMLRFGKRKLVPGKDNDVLVLGDDLALEFAEEVKDNFNQYTWLLSQTDTEPNRTIAASLEAMAERSVNIVVLVNATLITDDHCRHLLMTILDPVVGTNLDIVFVIVNSGWEEAWDEHRDAHPEDIEDINHISTAVKVSKAIVATGGSDDDAFLRKFQLKLGLPMERQLPEKTCLMDNHSIA